MTYEDLKNTILYVGRSKNYKKYREAYHKKTKYFIDAEDPHIILVPTFKASRIVEQALMEYYHTKNAYNKINSIAFAKRGSFTSYAGELSQAVISYLDNQYEEEYLEMIEIGQTLKNPDMWY